MSRRRIRLGVNVDHVATLRQARRADEPDPVHAAVLSLLGGADSITVHLREDRRHIQDRDVRLLKSIVPRLNLEMAVAPAIVEIACDVRPAEVTLVPEKREELTTEGGLDIVANESAIGLAIDRLKKLGVEVSLFVDPDPRQIEVSHRLGAKAVEIQTANYSEAKGEKEIRHELGLLHESGRLALARGLAVHLGHGLNYVNTCAVLDVPGVEELNIGHSIVARAVLVGMERAVREMKAMIAG